MSENTQVCSKCGNEMAGMERSDGKYGCPEDDDGFHDWSDADPLSRLEARIGHSGGHAVHDSGDNEDWQWVEVRITDHDRVGASEGLTSLTRREGFRFIGVGEPEDANWETLRFNRKKDDADAEEAAARAEMAAEKKLDRKREKYNRDRF